MAAAFGTPAGVILGRELDRLLLESRRALAQYLNAAADELVYILNATHGVKIAAYSLHLEPGDEILTSDYEYGPWDFICGKAAAQYIH